MIHDVLLIVVTLGAAGFLLFSLLEVVWPRRRARAVRAVVEDARTIAPEPASVPTRTLPSRRQSPHGPQPPTEVVPAPAGPVAVSDAGPAPDDEVPEIARCYELYEQQRFADVVAEATVILERGTAFAPRDAAALWGVVGLAKRALGDRFGAWSALQGAIAAAPESDRLRWEREIARLAFDVAQTLLESARNQTGGDAAQREETIQTAISWCEGALATAPTDAALWGVVGLAKQTLGDRFGAWSAIQKAIAVAPPTDRPAWEAELARLALSVGQTLLESAESHASASSTERVEMVRSALSWFEGGLVTVPNDPALSEAVEAARAALWRSYEEVATALIEGNEYDAARLLLDEALRDERLPPTQREALAGLRTLTVGGELGRLTTEGLRLLDEAEDEALAMLDRARELCRTADDTELPPARRAELERRLLRGYVKAGTRRMEAGAFDAALEPLFQGLALATLAGEQVRETVELLARAHEGLVDTRGPTIRRLAESGERETALIESDKLTALLTSSLERGLSREQLVGALAKAQWLQDQVGRRGR